jgi:hypothetical protein
MGKLLYCFLLYFDIRADLFRPDEIVASLSTNFYLNDLQDSSKIEAKQLKWGHALVGSEHPQWNEGRKIDLILGADLTYDSSWFPALTSTFVDILTLNTSAVILLAATVSISSHQFLIMCVKFRYQRPNQFIPPPLRQENGIRWHHTFTSHNPTSITSEKKLKTFTIFLTLLFSQTTVTQTNAHIYPRCEIQIPLSNSPISLPNTACKYNS